MKQTVLKNNLQNLLESAENILLLQGPVGDFFLRLANWLTENGKTVHNSTLMQATTIFIRPLKLIPLFLTTTTMPFLNFLQEYIVQHHIQAVVCFGDTRPYHVIAKRIATENQASFWAFEEGYFRPYYITLEKTASTHFPLCRAVPTFFLNNSPTGPTRI